MRQWIERLKWNIERWMRGRYGQDALSLLAYRVALVLILLTVLWPSGLLTILTVFCLAWSMFRSFSKNIGQREKELAVYERMIAKPKAFLSLQQTRWQDRKNYRYYKCSCGKILRVPRGRGKIEVTCPQCHAHMVKKS